MRANTTLAPLAIRPFRRLLGADALNLLGDWAGEIALAILVFAKTDSPLAVALLFLCLKALPAVASVPLAARLERLATRYSLPLVWLCEALVFIALALLAKSFWLPAVLALALVDGAFTLAAQTLVRSTTAALLKDSGNLRHGNALLNVTFTSGMAMGPMLGGIAVAAFGLQVALLIDASTFLITAGIMVSTTGLPAGVPEAARWLMRVRGGLAFLWKNIELRGLVFRYAVMVLFAAAVLPVEVVLVKDTLGASDLGYGIFLASWGLGSAAGGILFVIRSNARLYVLILLGTIAIAISYLGTAAAPTLAIACVMAAGGGLGNGISWVSVITAIQERTPGAFQARVVAVHNALSISLMPGVAYILGGGMAAAFSARTAFAVAGLGVLVALLASVTRLVPYARLETSVKRKALAGNASTEELSPKASESS